jgi:hypothetical protein
LFLLPPVWVPNLSLKTLGIAPSRENAFVCPPPFLPLLQKELVLLLLL